MKTLTYIAAAAAILSLAACSGKQAAETAAQDDAAATDTVVATATYTGVLPAADADGVEYAVELNYTSEDAGQYEMVQNYIVGDSISATFTTAGNFTVGTSDNGKYITLAAQDTTQNVYFVVASDSTITMVDATLTPAENPEMNYTLTAR